MLQQKISYEKNNKGKNARVGLQRINPPDLVYGKIPPQAQELETAVLGALMLEKTAQDLVEDFLKPEFFYVAAHQRIYNAMQRVSSKSLPVDILTVVHELKSTGELEMVGGPFYVTKLTNSVVSSANIEAHARIIHQKFIQRELIRISGDIINQAYEDTTDVFDLLDEAESGLFSISTGHLKNGFSKVDVLYEKETQELEKRMETKEEITGVPTGFKALDKVTCGWQPTDLIIIAARPSVGKTAFALNLARNAALNEYKRVGVAVFSLEMSKGQIMQRLIAAESSTRLDRIRRGKMEKHELQALHRACIHTIAMAPIYIDDTPALNIFELRANARRLVRNNGVGLIIVDYLQLMSGASDDRSFNREQEISRISRSLKNLAKELKVPVIALSQLSRDVEKRKDNKPQLSDLRESGAIEQDADFVAFLQRSDYQKDATEVDPSLAGDAELIIRKHRNGQLETIAFETDLSVQRFKDISAVTDEHQASRFITRREAERRFALETPPPPPAEEFDNDELPF